MLVLGGHRRRVADWPPAVQLPLLSPLGQTTAPRWRRRAARGSCWVPQRAQRWGTGRERGIAAAAAKEAAPAEAGPEEAPFFEEVSGDDPIVLELERRLRTMNGNSALTLDMVLNPGTIVNAEREVILLRAELSATPDEDTERRKELEDKIEQKQMKIVNEMRQVMTDNLKLEFLLQAALSVPAFASMCYGTFPFVPDLRWLGINRLGVKLALCLFGVWGIWLVTVPALRARKPGGPYGLRYEEKRALDVSFLILPFVCFLTPFLSKDPTVTFWASVAVVLACYAWSFVTPLEAEAASRGVEGDGDLPEPVRWALKALDFGTGAERGARAEDSTWKEQLASYQRAAEELAARKAKRPEAQ